MTQPVVYLATIEDLPWIRQLWRDMVTESGPIYPTNILASLDAFTRSIALALTTSPAQAFVFLAQLPHSAAPDAFLAYEIQVRHIGEPSRLGFVHYIYTSPHARGHGLATTLCEIGAEHMMAQGLTYCEATTVPGDARFHDLGFIPYEVRLFTPLAQVPDSITRRRRPRGNGHDLAATEFEVPPPIPGRVSDDE